MLKFPKIEGAIAQEVREALTKSIPPQLATKADVSLAMDMAIHAVNSAFAAAETTLQRLPAEPGAQITRAISLVLFMQLMEVHLGASKDAMNNVFARLAAEELMRSMGLHDGGIVATVRES